MDEVFADAFIGLRWQIRQTNVTMPQNNTMRIIQSEQFLAGSERNRL